MSEIDSFSWTVTFEDIELKLKLHIQEKQTSFFQAQEILVSLAKSILGSSDTTNNSNATMTDKMNKLPTVQHVDDLRQWFKGNKQNG